MFVCYFFEFESECCSIFDLKFVEGANYYPVKFLHVRCLTNGSAINMKFLNDGFVASTYVVNDKKLQILNILKCFKKIHNNKKTNT